MYMCTYYKCTYLLYSCQHGIRCQGHFNRFPELSQEPLRDPKRSSETAQGPPGGSSDPLMRPQRPPERAQVSTPRTSVYIYIYTYIYIYICFLHTYMCIYHIYMYKKCKMFCIKKRNTNIYIYIYVVCIYMHI